MKQGKQQPYGAQVTITGHGHQISGGALIGCATAPDPAPLAYAYVLQGRSYPVIGTPRTTWTVTVNGTKYSFPASDEGKTWTADTMEVAVLSINIRGTQSAESPGYLVYWPVAVDSNGYVQPPTSGSSGAYFDANSEPHSVDFRTTWSVPDFNTTFTWNSTDPYAGPYTCHKPHTGYGDDDTWVSGDPTPGGQ